MATSVPSRSGRPRGPLSRRFSNRLSTHCAFTKLLRVCRLETCDPADSKSALRLRGFHETPASIERQLNHAFTERLVTQSRCCCRLGQQARLRHARQSIHFEHHRLAARAHHHIHARVIASTDGAKGSERGRLDAGRYLTIEWRGAKIFRRARRVFIAVVIGALLRS